LAIEVINVHPKLKVNKSSLKNLIKGIVNRLNLKIKDVSVVLVDDDYIRELNKKYRKIDSPTDVLSFSMEEDKVWGDIYISLDTAIRQAQLQGWELEKEIRFLMVHGFLHLVGYDDETEEGYNQMMSLTNELLDLCL
jgi:probable rRNA maturation factor